MEKLRRHLIGIFNRNNMNKYPFNVNNIDFYVDIRQDLVGYKLQAFFSDGKPANYIVYEMKYEDNDNVKLHTGSPGVQNLLYAVVNTVKEGFYEGSTNYYSFIDPHLPEKISLPHLNKKLED